jgi:pantoate--beta-alanine ligase
MGALHDGHIALVHAARRHVAVVVVSIFVNPGQFGPNEDFDRYPRSLEADIERLKHANVDVVFTPTVEDLYPTGYANATRVRVPKISRRFCGQTRPHFFEGVCSVVARLLNIVRPAIAVFGEKDFQQLTIIRQMVADLVMGIEIVGVPIIREPDGLAMSSRNRYLSDDDRSVATHIYQALQLAGDRIVAGDRQTRNVTAFIRQFLSKFPIRIDYIEITDTHLNRINVIPYSGRILIAAWVGNTRLIDNLALPAISEKV